MRTESVAWLAAAVAVEFTSMAAFAMLQRRMLVAAGARVTLRRMTGLAFAANAINATLPGGTALSVGYAGRRLRAWGASTHAAAFALVASGLLSTATYALLVVGMSMSSGATITTLFSAVGIALAAVLVAVQRERAIRLFTGLARWAVVRFGRLRRRSAEASLAPLDRLAAGLRAIRTTPGDWAAGFAFAAVNWLADLGCLVASCHAMGVDQPGLVAVSGGYLAGMAASSFSFLPAGIGATDVAIVLALTHAGANTAGATAAVVCYRVISVGLVVVAGWLVFLAAWRKRHVVRPGVSRIRAGAAVPSFSDNNFDPTSGGRHVLDPDRHPVRRSRRSAAPQLRRRRRHALLRPQHRGSHPPAHRPQR